MLTFILTLLLKIGSNCLDLKGHFVSDVKIGRASNLGAFLDISEDMERVQTWGIVLSSSFFRKALIGAMRKGIFHLQEHLKKIKTGSLSTSQSYRDYF